MNTFVLEIFDNEGSLCTFYTVRWDHLGLSETDKFFQKFSKEKQLQRPLQELAKFIEVVIGNEKGALDDFFRFENQANALPPKGKHKVEEITIDYRDFPLRLYCLRISDYLVVLFNGAEKTDWTAQGGKTSMVFIEANQFAKRILNALQQGDIYIAGNHREFKNYDGSDELIIY